jgi:hypothetical protein
VRYLSKPKLGEKFENAALIHTDYKDDDDDKVIQFKLVLIVYQHQRPSNRVKLLKYTTPIKFTRKEQNKIK